MRIITLDGGYKSWGRQGENLATTLRINASCLYAEYPDGMPMVAFARADGSKYYVAHEMNEDHIVSVVLTSIDTDVHGVVFIELQWMQDDIIKKSIMFKGYIEKSIHEVDVPPETDPSWCQQIEQHIGNLNTLKTDAQSNIVESINELYGAISDDGYYKSLNKIKDYLYEITYDDIDYNYAYEYFAEHSVDVPVGACSAVRNGNYYGRNFDWMYNNHAEFIVHTAGINGINKVLGVSGDIAGLTEEFVTNNKTSAKYKLIPFNIVDGINQHKLVANTNVVPADKGTNTAIPTGTSEVTINSCMLVRYILDNFSSAWRAANYICEHVTVVPFDLTHELHYEMHWMLADENNTVLLEIVENRMVATDVSSHPYMTNFYLNGVTLNSDGTVYTPYTQDDSHDAIHTNHVTELGSGLERWNYIVNNYNVSSTKTGMHSLMDGLKYSNAYTIINPADVWYTEFVGMHDLTVGDEYTAFEDAVNEARNAYASRSRDDPKIWQSCHSCVYDIQDRKLYIIAQEDGEEIQISFSNSEPTSTVEYGETLELIDNVLNVKTTNVVQADNTLPVTSAAVHMEVGNINALLATI